MCVDGVLGTDGDKVEWEVIRKELQSPETKGFPRLLITHACRNTADNGSQFYNIISKLLRNHNVEHSSFFHRCAGKENPDYGRGL